MNGKSLKETERLTEDTRRERNWKRFGPYLSERQWGTVREDYSPYGEAWGYLSHDQARSRAYRFGEEALAMTKDMIQGYLKAPSPPQAPRHTPRLVEVNVA